MTPAPSDVASIARGLTKGATRALLLMTADWQFCGKATFDANGAYNAHRKASVAVEKILTRDPEGWSRWAYRLTPLGLAVRAHLLEVSNG